MISDLIYYHETATFYDKFYHEIEEMRCEWIENDMELNPGDNDLKNFYAWAAFEETARNIAEQDLELEI